MSNGFLIAAAADLAAAHDIAGGFGLDVVDASAGGDGPALLAALKAAPNVGILLSTSSAQDEMFESLVEALSEFLAQAQLILIDDGARAAFPYLPPAWPELPYTEALRRAQILASRHAGPLPPRSEAEPQPPTPPPLPEPAPPAPEAQAEPAPAPAPPPEELIQEQERELSQQTEDYERAITLDDAPSDAPSADEPASGEDTSLDMLPPLASLDVEGGESDHEPGADAFAVGAPPQQADEPPAPMAAPAPVPPALKPDEPAREAPSAESYTSNASYGAGAPLARKREAARAAAPSSAPADATAFAPKKLRRGTPELVRIVLHQPKDLAAVIKAARKIDPRAAPAPQGMSIGEVAIGAKVGVSLEVRGGACDGALQRRTWLGEPIDFSFTLEADDGVKQAVILARVFVDDAQIGVIAFTRPITGAIKESPLGDKVRMKRHKRVFLSYSSQDRETVSTIATAYEMAGVEHFWDRTSLKSGEEWHPRLRREIDRADLFHLCWSKAASASEWVEREAEYALTRRRRANGKKPDITVQMLDGPPWAPHPPSLDSINFDDFVRAAIVGYARGDGGGD